MRIKGLYVVRSGGLAAPVATRAEGEDEEAASATRMMELRFAPFGTQYEINSWWEGRFIEQIERGSFKRTIKSLKRSDGNYSMKSLFNHGMDFNVGDKLLGTVSSLSEEEDSPVALVDLYDSSYVRDLEPGIRAGDYGSSFMFEVLRDKWDHEPDPDESNPEGLPIRTIQEVRLLEAGPVTFPANPSASAGMRGGSITDAFIERQIERGHAERRDTMAMFDAFRAAHGLPGRDAPAPGSRSARHADESKAKRAARLREMTLTSLCGGTK